MKKKCYLILLLTLLPLGGCFNEVENELSRLERRIEKLEQRCKEMNTTLEGLRTIVDKLDTYDFLKQVETLYQNGKVIGYTLYFTHSDPVTLYNGTDAETPVLGVQKGEDGVWYWTVKYPSETEAHFLTDNYGVRISTSAASPEFKIENGYWLVTYDGGEIWHNLGRATGEDGASFFKSIEDMGDYVLFNMLNGTSVQLPTWSSFEKLEESCRKLNQNLETFMKLVSDIKDKVYVSDIIPILSGEDTIGFTLTLSDGSSYSFYDGTGTNAPVIGAQQDEAAEDVWYWTIRYGSDAAEWILDEKGQRIRANAPQGLTPSISLLKDTADDTYYWAVAYGDQKPTYLLCNGKRVPASVNVPDPVVLSVVSVQDDMVSITLNGGQSVLIPLARTFTVSLSAPVSGNKLTMGAKELASFKCTLSRADKRAEVLPVTQDGFYAEAYTTDHVTWTIDVYSPDDFAAPSTSRLNLLVSNGYGSMKTLVVTIQAK
ncbi:MAG: hypothetical protein IKX34_08435 [Bacteroidales bacterium]|nr:hypothetical protein [Bacteroidales bacterium]